MGGQALVQGVNVLSGLIIIRALPRDTAYAWFTIASSMMAVISLLSDAGTGAAANALGGAVWRDKFRFTQTIQSVFRYRKKLALLAAGVGVPWAVILFNRVGTGWLDMGIVISLIVVSAWPATSSQVLGAVNRLYSRYMAQVYVEVVGAATRLLLTSATLVPVLLLYGSPKNGASFGPSLLRYGFVAAVLAACLPSFLSLKILKKQVAGILVPGVADTREFDLSIRKSIKHLYPTSIYYCLQGQLATWLVSFFGGAGKVADFGALSRLAAIFSILGAPIQQIAGPSFARCAEKHTLIRQLTKVIGAHLGVSLVLLFIVTIWPHPVLSIIGPQYDHLENELFLFVLMSLLAGVYAIQGAVVTARGWVRHSYLVIPAGILSQIGLAFLLPLDTLSGVLWFNILSIIPNLLVGAFMIFKGFAGDYGAFVFEAPDGTRH